MAQAQGKIVQCIGAVVDVEFPRDQMPRVYDALKLEGSALTLEGPWAWFRLLDQSELIGGASPDRFNLRIRLDRSSVAYELRASSAFNPFKSRAVAGFTLPERL